ncbi:MAG: hypothetical protein Q7K45_05025, partial [Nanoarchaeota archaeon]|nr:hypothetical protein [Nanoarchaeota archaeon]
KYLVDFFKISDYTLFFEYYQGILNREFPNAAASTCRNEVGSSGKQDLRICSLVKDLTFREHQEFHGEKRKLHIGERFGEYNAVAINSLILPRLLPGARVARQYEVEEILNSRALNYCNHRDGDELTASFILWNAGDDDSLSSRDWMVKEDHRRARSLANQIQEKTRKFNPPYHIEVADLVLMPDPESPLGVDFKLKESAKIVRAPASVLEKGLHQYFHETDKHGLPKEVISHYNVPHVVRRFGGHHKNGGPMTGVRVLAGDRCMNLNQAVMNHASYYQRLLVVKPVANCQ